MLWILTRDIDDASSSYDLTFHASFLNTCLYFHTTYIDTLFFLFRDRKESFRSLLCLQEEF